MPSKCSKFINSNIIILKIAFFFSFDLYSEFHIDIQKMFDEDMDQKTLQNTQALYFKGLFLYKYNGRRT